MRWRQHPGEVNSISHPTKIIDKKDSSYRVSPLCEPLIILENSQPKAFLNFLPTILISNEKTIEFGKTTQTQIINVRHSTQYQQTKLTAPISSFNMNMNINQ
jgi:hypothetical protein